MKHRQIEAFNAFMHTGTVSLAASKLGISQPAVSRLLSSLEKSLDIKLFIRKKNKVEPTEDAKSLYKLVLRSFVGMDEISNHAKAIANKQIGSISISAQAVYIDSYLIDVIAEFKLIHPNVQITLAEEGMVDMLEKVNSRRCDFGIGVTINTDFADIDVIPITNCQAVCVMPKYHPLTKKEVISFSDIQEEPLIELNVGSPLRMRIDHLFYSHDVLRRNIAVEALKLSTICSLIEKEVGIGIVDAFAIKNLNLDKVIVKPFKPKIEWNIGIFSQKGYHFNSLEQEFLDLVKSKTDKIYQEVSKYYL